MGYMWGTSSSTKSWMRVGNSVTIAYAQFQVAVSFHRLRRSIERNHAKRL